MTSALNGVLAVNKPSGMTSHDVVAIMRRAGKERRLGHTGTLDPAATGVLVLCFGAATRLIPYLDETDKVYQAHLILGRSTDTQDYTGTVVRATPETHISREELLQAMAAFRGEIRQIPPMYSAVKREGRPLYELARQGLKVEREARTMTIFELEPLEPLADSYQAGEGPWLRIRCSKGTYIRTLCHDMGEYLGCGAHMRELNRWSSGSFTLNDAVELEQAKTWGEDGTLKEHLMAPARAVGHLMPLELTEQNVYDLGFGRRIKSPSIKPVGSIAAGLYQSSLVAILRSQGEGLWQPVKVFSIN